MPLPRVRRGARPDEEEAGSGAAEAPKAQNDADASLGDRVPCVLDGHSQLKGDELDQVEVMSFNEN